MAFRSLRAFSFGRRFDSSAGELVRDACWSSSHSATQSLLWDACSVHPRTFRYSRPAVCFSGDRIQVEDLPRLCRLRRCRSLQCFLPCPRRRDAASSARPDLRIADTAVLRERTLAADRPDADTLSIALISLDSLFFMRLCCGRVRIGPFAFPIGAEPSIAKRFRTVLFSSLLA